jgi:dGTPase
LEFKGQQMVVSVYEALKSEPGSLLPADARLGWEKAENKERAICDYVAGMTDAFLLRTYERMFSPRMGSVFDKL